MARCGHEPWKSGATGAVSPHFSPSRRGFNVHAKVVVDGRDRPRLERLCRYLARPPIAKDRLERTSDGRLRYELKKPWRDGTVAVFLEPLDLMARLCAMVPPPRFHMVRSHGVLAPHAALRAQVVPKPPKRSAPEPAAPSEQLALFMHDRTPEDPQPQPRRKPWAWLLRHVFEIDVTVCPECQGSMQWREVATTPEAIARLLASAGLAARPPPSRRAPSGQLELHFRS